MPGMDPDVLLIVSKPGVKEEVIKVYHQVMVNASPVFATMLRPDRYAEGVNLQRDNHLKLLLPEDDPEAMKVICSIIHLQSWNVPVNSITTDLLHDIATLVDKYDFSKLIRPWPEIWLKQPHVQHELSSINEASPDLCMLLRWIHISYHLGYAEQFESFTSSLIANVSTKDFELPTFGEAFVDLPWDVQCTIRKRRQDGIERFCLHCNYFVDLLVMEPHCEHGPCGNIYNSGAQEEHFHCASILLGNAILALNQEFGLFWEKDNTWIASLWTLKNKIANIEKKMVGPSMIISTLAGNRDRTRATKKAHAACKPILPLEKNCTDVYNEVTTGLRLADFAKHTRREKVTRE